MPKKIAALLFVCLCFLPLQASGGDDLAKSGKARVDAAEKAYKAWYDGQRNFAVGLGNPDTLLYDLSVRWLRAEIDLATKKEERIAAYAAHLERMKDWAKLLGGPVGRNAPLPTIIDATVKEAEYWLVKERAGK